MNKVWLVFPGLGKTYAASKTDKILEVQLSRFKNRNVQKYGEHFPEHLKGNLEVALDLNPDYPNNAIQHIRQGLTDGKIPVLALKSDNIKFVVEHNFDFEFVVPHQDKLEQLKQQYIARGNTLEYVTRNMSHAKNILGIVGEYNKPIIYVHKDQHLLDLL